jgi:hypothetical protein
VRVYETVVSPVTNSPQEQLADSMTLHIVPSFLLVDDEYFADRENGYKILGGIVDELDKEYSISVTPGPIDPMWQVRSEAESVTATLAAYEALAQREPERMQQLMSQRMEPAVSDRART